MFMKEIKHNMLIHKVDSHTGSSGSTYSKPSRVINSKPFALIKSKIHGDSCVSNVLVKKLKKLKKPKKLKKHKMSKKSSKKSINKHKKTIKAHKKEKKL